MFHKHLDQASKRYKEHPNVAAMYTSLPKDKAHRPQRAPTQDYPPKIRDFAYDKHESETNTRDFIAKFADFGFRSHHRRVNNGDLLSKAGVLGYEKKRQLQDPSVGLKAQFPGCFDMDYHPPQRQERPVSETTTTTATNSVSSDLSGTTDTPSLATSATMESLEEGSNGRRPRGIRDNPLILAVAVCMLEYMN
ncbi:hypothetical protein HO133_000736 [Letharia lupina]|uniref:Uncharacterized protein n=1 Tax=Letharia lupina TaxID=560253 RepID=A0A8H6CFT6_9LECA|nr:uncharacterized protein HO133_000736 [Letharia lupina]KAF6222689.1 hypothetical protein HO133_000736 [Letharia lupina]